MFDNIPPALQAVNDASCRLITFECAHERALIRARLCSRQNGYGFEAAWLPRDLFNATARRRAVRLGALVERDPAFAARCREKWQKYLPLLAEEAKLQAAKDAAWEAWQPSRR